MWQINCSDKCANWNAVGVRLVAICLRTVCVLCLCRVQRFECLAGVFVSVWLLSLCGGHRGLSQPPRFTNYQKSAGQWPTKPGFGVRGAGQQRARKIRSVESDAADL